MISRHRKSKNSQNVTLIMALQVFISAESLSAAPKFSPTRPISILPGRVCRLAIALARARCEASGFRRMHHRGFPNHGIHPEQFHGAEYEAETRPIQARSP